VVKASAERCGLDIAAHDLRRTFAKLSCKGGGDLKQTQLTLGHASVTTTERYLGEEQDLTSTPWDVICLRLN
jgi:site-specific recombinase XerD